MMQQHICLAAFDEASAADGSCPLEQIADASGIAVGGSVVQMSRDLSKLKVLMTHSKSLTPAPPLTQEAFAQLEVKRATRKTFGSIRTLCWTDHVNLTRAQTSDIGMDPKLVRWVAEILILEDEKYLKRTKLSKWAPYLRAIWKMKNIWVFKGHLKTVKQGMPQSWHLLKNAYRARCSNKKKHIV